MIAVSEKQYGSSQASSERQIAQDVSDYQDLA